MTPFISRSQNDKTSAGGHISGCQRGRGEARGVQGTLLIVIVAKQTYAWGQLSENYAQNEKSLHVKSGESQIRSAV